MIHDAQVTRITYMVRNGTSIYLAECNCGWTGGRYWDLEDLAEAQVFEHLKKFKDWEKM